MKIAKNNIFLKNVYRWLFFLIVFTFVISGHTAPVIDRWDLVKATYFKDEIISDAQNQIQIDAPKQAEDASLVPFTFKVNLQDDYIDSVYLITDANPIMLTATFSMKSMQNKFEISTRIRLEKNTIVRVITKSQHGQLFMKTISIKTPGGGCGGGDMTDEAKLRASAGEIKMRMLNSDGGIGANFVLNIKHPMRTGFERTFQGYYAKAWFVENIDFLIENKSYFHAILGPGISANPYFKFNLPKQSETSFSVLVKDNEGKLFQQQIHS